MGENNELANNQDTLGLSNQNNTDLNNTSANTDVSQGQNSNTNTQPETVESLKAQLNEVTQKYSASSTEAKKLATQLKETQFYSQVGYGLVQRLQSDPAYRQKFESLSDEQKQAVVNQSVTNEQAGGTQATQAPQLPAQPVEDSWVREKKQEEQNRIIQVWTEVEGEDTAEIDKYNQTRIDPKTGMPVMLNGFPVIDNPVRQQMGAMARMLQAKGIPMEEAARRAKMAWKVAENPEIVADPKQAQLQGLLEGLETSSMRTYGSSRGTGQRQKQIQFDDEQQAIFRQLGLDPNSDSLAKKFESGRGF